jgi:predicted choloylglycine hydrolase
LSDAEGPTRLSFQAISQAEPGEALREIFERYWPSYRRWLARVDGGPTAEESEAQLRAHMPVLVPTYEALVDLVGADEEQRRFFTLYCPPPVVRACTQAIIPGEGGSIVRNYDHAPHLCDGIVLESAFGGVPTIAMTDCLWGALDGVNRDGLAMALAFGGRPETGRGFGASLILRYVLQTCTDVAGAIDVLGRVPISMAYTFVALDASGAHATAFASPGRSTVVDRGLASTNHQRDVEWPEYAQFTESVERLACTRALLAAEHDVASLVGAFLRPPLYRTAYARGSGTLYTSVLAPSRRSIDLHWPGQGASFTLGDVHPMSIDIELVQP